MSHTHISSGHKTIIKGSDRELNVTLYDEDGSLFKLEDPPDEITSFFFPQQGSDLLERTLGNSQISLTDAASGKIKIKLANDFSITMREDEHQDFQINVEQNGNVHKFRLERAITVKAANIA